MTTENYQYNYNTNFAPLAMLKGMLPPRKPSPNIKWVKLVLEKVLRILLNNCLTQKSLDAEVETALSEIKADFFESRDVIEDQEIDRIIQNLSVAATKSQKANISKSVDLFDKVRQSIKKNSFSLEDFLLEDFLELVKLLLNQSETSRNYDRPQSLEEYEEQFSFLIRLPEVSKNFKEDLQFANMRVAGPNPLVIERMTKEDPRFPVTDDQYQLVMKTSDSIQKALSGGRLYLADYRVLEDALQGTYPQEQKYICAPLAMFAVPEKGHKHYPYLCPIAIQCFQEPGDNNPIFTPQDGNWLIAKTIVQIADANFHEAISHLGRTHLFIEPFVIATYRKLPEDHVLRKLLLPHFEGTLLINWGARNILTIRCGNLDQLLAQTISASRVVATKGAQSYLFDFNGSMLLKTLEDRGVDSNENLPYYPYRDDAMKIWEAIHNWVKGYLKDHYANSTDVENDQALQEWVEDLLSHEGGRLKNFGENGKISTLDYLIDATTMIVFTASAQHAAVNFPQSKIMSYTPAMPLAGYSPAPTKINSLNVDQSFLNLLPPLDIARTQLNTRYLLGSVYQKKAG